jgi:cyclic pyranopterin phosphate synthase
VSLALPVFGRSGQPTAPPSPLAGLPPAAPSHARRPNHLTDSHGRVIRDLRLSVTDRCNFRCVYCMDPDFRYMPKQQLLTLEEYVTLVRVCLSLGITKVRITGGEPTLYPQINELIHELGKMPGGIPDLAITTNGSLLDRMPLDQWKRDGLRRITLSLDSLRPERVRSITRTDATPASVIRAIHLAREAGFDPIKVNAVIMRGVNDDEVADFADFALEHGIDMRLIEFMPLDSSRAWDRSQVVSADEMLEKIRARHELIAVEDDDPSSTSMNFVFVNQRPSLPPSPHPFPRGKGSEPRIGIIAPVTRPFCGACSRLRITADGKVRPCLFSLSEWDLKPVLREHWYPGSASRETPVHINGAENERMAPGSESRATSDERLRDFLIDAMWTKQAGHGIGSTTFTQPERTMSAIGG